MSGFSTPPSLPSSLLVLVTEEEEGGAASVSPPPSLISSADSTRRRAGTISSPRMMSLMLRLHIGHLTDRMNHSSMQL